MAVDLARVVRTRLDPAERYGLRLTLIGLAVVIVAIPFATLTFEVLGEGPLTRFDGRFADALNDWVQGRPGAVPILGAVSYLGKPVFLFVVVALAVVILWRPGRHRATIFLVTTSLGGGIVDTLVKVAVDRPRPVVDHPVATAFGKSFPSGHAMSSTVTYGALLVALWPYLAPRFRRGALAVTMLVVAAVGTSRLLLGLHFVTDVVGGYLLGLAWLAGAVAAFSAWRHDQAVDDVITGIAHPDG